MNIKERFKCILSVVLVVSGLVLAPTVNAEIQTYEGIGEYMMSDFETIEIAKQRAKIYAERNAQEKAGVYVSSYSKSNNAILTADEIEAMTATIIEVLDVKYETIPTDDGVKYRAMVKVNIDSDEIPRWLARDKKEREELIVQNKELKKAFEEQDKSLTELKRKVLTNPGDKDDLKQSFYKIESEFLSNDKIVEGNKLFDNEDYTNAIKIYTEAINLSPDNIFAYSRRGIAYMKTEEFVSAISDLTKFISYYPNDYYIYLNRGVAYLATNQLENGLNDLSKAIEIRPNASTPYAMRGIVYMSIGQTEKAQADMAKAKELGYEP